jgi:hypothetical protein
MNNTFVVIRIQERYIFVKVDCQLSKTDKFNKLNNDYVCFELNVSQRLNN